MVLNEEQWIKELREKRIAYGISQGRLAVASGITREYLNKIESGKMKPSKELLNTLHKELAKFNPEAPLTMLFDYGGFVTDDHLFINRLARIKTIDIIPYNQEGDFTPTWHTVNDNMEHIDKNTLKAVGQTVLEVIYNEK